MDMPLFRREAIGVATRTLVISAFMALGAAAVPLTTCASGGSLNAGAQQAGHRLTNQDVIGMEQLGLSDDVIIAKIREAAASAGGVSFDTSLDGLKGLKAAKVSDAVIKAMINPAPAPVAMVTAAPMTLDPNLPPPEIGVYWKNGAKFVLIEGRELTDAKVGGRTRSFFTQGLSNEHWDATLDGRHSGNRVTEKRTFYLYVPDGKDANDFVLIRLHEKSNRREFQVGYFGGALGGKSGVPKKEEIPFASEHVGLRTYKITLSADLPPGEYAFFMGRGQSETMAKSDITGTASGGMAQGRIYDFTIPE